tara:strand:- start:963 stop:1193 length:231 start_codon:yes stop_codon:yes gene_type:complete
MKHKNYKVIRCNNGFKCEMKNCTSFARWVITDLQEEKNFNKKGLNNNPIDTWLCQKHFKIIYPKMYKKIIDKKRKT